MWKTVREDIRMGEGNQRWTSVVEYNPQRFPDDMVTTDPTENQLEEHNIDQTWIQGGSKEQPPFSRRLVNYRMY